MITVHHLGISQSERIVWLCEELGIAYELKTYPREPNGAAPAAYKALHPQGTAPVITDGSLVLAETGAIVDYILARHGGGRLVLGPQAPDFPDYLYWLYSTLATASSCLTTMRAIAGRSLGASPHLRAYLERIGARPAYQSAMKKADPEMKLALE
jgi:glutathione S-transferase